MALVGEEGVQGLTVDAVAARAGTSKATIYRRWPSKEALLLESVRELKANDLVFEDTGDLDADLRRAYQAVAVGLNTPPVGDVLPHLLAVAATSPEFRSELLAFVRSRRGPVRALLEAAVVRGDLPGDVDVDRVIDLMSGPLFYRMLILGEPIDPALVDLTVGNVLSGLRGRPATGVRTSPRGT